MTMEIESEAGIKACRLCAHYEKYEHQHLEGFASHSCKAKPKNAHLRQFPFKRTKCKFFKRDDG